VGWRRGPRSERFQVAFGLIHGELVDTPVGFFAAGDGDGFLELGAAGVVVPLLGEEAALEDQRVCIS